MAPSPPPSHAYPGYRWIVLALYSLLSLTIEIQWLTFAPIAREARSAYGVSAFQIDLLSLVFLVLFLVVCIPASHAIDRYGVRKAVGFGALLTGAFGLAKGVLASTYLGVLVCQIGLAVAQPFILNAVTKVALDWFPLRERATAVGIATLAQFLGFIVVSLAAPRMVEAAGGSYSLGTGLMTWGAISAVAAAAFLLLVRDAPEAQRSREAADQQPPGPRGLLHVLGQRDVALVVALFFIGLGIFNAIATCIDQICERSGLTSADSGAILGAMFIAGVVGAIAIPPLSDRLGRRKPFLVAATALTAPGLAGMTFGQSYGVMLASAAVVGCFLLGAAGPIGFQYAAEVSRPAPESLSQGLVLLAGQVAGIVFVVGMNAAGTRPFMVAFVGLALVNVALALSLRESKVLLAGRPLRTSHDAP
jgi:nitrate/nitrite transporter NarK